MRWRAGRRERRKEQKWAPVSITPHPACQSLLQPKSDTSLLSLSSFEGRDVHG